jgi:peroxisomal 3,2-trans-enoyl-CoA isomerase
MSAVTVKYRGRIAIITLNVPAKLNALTSEGYFLLAHCMRKVAHDPEIVVTVLTGRGRLFSA